MVAEFTVCFKALGIIVNNFRIQLSTSYNSFVIGFSLFGVIDIVEAVSELFEDISTPFTFFEEFLIGLSRIGILKALIFDRPSWCLYFER